MGLPVELVRQLLDIVDESRAKAAKSQDPIKMEKTRRVVQAVVKLCCRYAELEGLSLKEVDKRLTSTKFYESRGEDR